MTARRVLLEILKFLYGLVVAGMLFLFLCLILDLYACWVGGGWNPLLGSWPIFRGTVGELLYGSWGMIICLLSGLGGIARIVLWQHTPSLLSFLTQPTGEDFV